ncbi:hypothetical protein K443DRAFT_683776 [Laccaria amethystina LaAM-08-1]|jgi:hypothetical protein|uniref:Uncharacterized protein n=1 Tax=Laccaria amethystina LaAM-08-1 TaxID=1095629 RepID=A0A0C9X9Q3_9AGAR|nr:hypothetical protein K443DRAFT_683776 [Laccaria amethystina LaAM-08-1]
MKNTPSTAPPANVKPTVPQPQFCEAPSNEVRQRYVTHLDLPGQDPLQIREVITTLHAPAPESTNITREMGLKKKVKSLGNHSSSCRGPELNRAISIR